MERCHKEQMVRRMYRNDRQADGRTDGWMDNDGNVWVQTPNMFSFLFLRVVYVPEGTVRAIYIYKNKVAKKQ